MCSSMCEMPRNDRSSCAVPCRNHRPAATDRTDVMLSVRITVPSGNRVRSTPGLSSFVTRLPRRHKAEAGTGLYDWFPLGLPS